MSALDRLLQCARTWQENTWLQYLPSNSPQNSPSVMFNVPPQGREELAVVSDYTRT